MDWVCTQAIFAVFMISVLFLATSAKRGLFSDSIDSDRYSGMYVREKVRGVREENVCQSVIGQGKRDPPLCVQKRVCS